MTFGILFLGFGLGLLFVLPPGPLAVTLVEVGVTQGRTAGLRSGVGIAAGDLAVGGAAGIVVAAGGALPESTFAAIQAVSAIVLVALGVLMIVRPSAVESLAHAVTRPARTFFLLTLLTPTVFGAWLAVIAALPFADDLAAIAVFVIGVGIASALYHCVLGSAAGEFGRHLSGAVMTRIAQGGGVLFGLLGVAMLIG